jgi:SPP1 family predicted phage head-tail adaptor
VQSVINAGEYNKRITIYTITEQEDKDGFVEKTEAVILSPYAKVKTTKGFTLISSNTDFEKAFTNFTIRYPKTKITRDMLIRYNGKEYTIEYLNNVDEANVELEIQAKEVTK